MGLSLALLGLLSPWEGEIVIPVLVSGSPWPPLEAAVEKRGVGVTLGEENGQDSLGSPACCSPQGFLHPP